MYQISSCLFYLCFLFILCLEIPFQASFENPSSDIPPLTLCIRLVCIVYILIAQSPFYFRTYYEFNKMIASIHNYVIEDQVSFCLFSITLLSLANLLVHYRYAISICWRKWFLLNEWNPYFAWWIYGHRKRHFVHSKVLAVFPLIHQSCSLIFFKLLPFHSCGNWTFPEQFTYCIRAQKKRWMEQGIN